MVPSRCKSVAAFLLALCTMASRACADEGGVGFWLPGEFGSLSATPLVPGWTIGIVNIYESIGASGVAAARESLRHGRCPGWYLRFQTLGKHWDRSRRARCRCRIHLFRLQNWT